MKDKHRFRKVQPAVQTLEGRAVPAVYFGMGTPILGLAGFAPIVASNTTFTPFTVANPGFSNFSTGLRTTPLTGSVNPTGLGLGSFGTNRIGFNPFGVANAFRTTGVNSFVNPNLSSRLSTITTPTVSTSPFTSYNPFSSPSVLTSSGILGLGNGVATATSSGILGTLGTRAPTGIIPATFNSPSSFLGYNPFNPGGIFGGSSLLTSGTSTGSSFVPTATSGSSFLSPSITGGLMTF